MKFLKPWLPLLISVATTLLLLKLGFVTALEPVAQRLLFQARGPQPWSSEIVIIKIDQASIDVLGWFPWQRDRYTQLLEELTAAEVDTVAFNILFSEETVADQAFAKAMADHGKVILASTWHENLLPWMPNPTLTQQALAIGHITQVEETTNPPKVLPQIQGYPALAIAAVQAYQASRGQLQLPDAHSAFLPNWPGPAKQLKQYSFTEILERKVPKNALKDKIVLVGMTAKGFDPLATPFDPQYKASGIHLHAAVAHSFLEQNFFKSPSMQNDMNFGLMSTFGDLEEKQYICIDVKRASMRWNYFKSCSPACLD